MEQTANEEVLSLGALDGIPAPSSRLARHRTATGYRPDELSVQSVSMFLPQQMRSKHNHLLKSFFLHAVSLPMGMVS